VSRGLQRADEKPPEDHWATREPENEQKLLDEYYKFKGWTNEGVPTKLTLDKLGLGDVADELIERGLISGDEDICYTDQSCYSEGRPKDAEVSFRKADSFTLTEYNIKNK
jgi:aldehyde:ferredoxin oxidoreductase